MNHDRDTAAALDILFHAAAKDAVLADNYLVSRLHQIGKTAFHTRRTRCRYGKGELVLGLENILQQSFHFIHHADKTRIQMTYCRPGHGG